MYRSDQKMEGDGEETWVLGPSQRSLACYNPIRALAEKSFLPAMQRCDKELFKLATGDPSIFGNLEPHPAVNVAVKATLDSSDVNTNGYPHSAGLLIARKAIAEHLSTENHKLSPEDVIMTPGTAGALEMAMSTLCERGRTILLPKPGFSLFKCLASNLELKQKLYTLLPERGWEVDLEDLERQIDDNTAAIIVNNPSNPCGSVYSRQHLLDILAVAERKKVPIISDDVYAGMVFKGQEYHSLGLLSEKVPILSCCSLSKRYLIPGWRCGWLAIYDKQGLLGSAMRLGLQQLPTRLLNPSAIIQAALPAIFKNVPESFFAQTIEVFENNAKTCYSILSKVPGLHPVMPAGSMFIMTRVELDRYPEFKDDTTFVTELIAEQGVTCIPGSVFGYDSSFRIALMIPNDKLNIACNRISEFCSKHYRK